MPRKTGDHSERRTVYASVMMRCFFAFAFLIGGVVLTQVTRAEEVRFPPAGKHGFHVSLPRGWTTKTDTRGGMLLVPPNQYAVVYLSIIIDDKLSNQSDSAVAAAQAKIVGIESIDSQSPARISDGKNIFKGTAFFAKMPAKHGLARRAKIVIVRLEPNTWAQVWTVTQPGMNAIESDALDHVLNDITLTADNK
jgi:hypothetical protein